MKLYLSKADHLQSSYSPLADGTTPLYQTESSGRITVLKKFYTDGSQTTGTTASTGSSGGESTEVGRLKFSMFSTLVKLGEKTYETAVFKRSRVFEGPDGNEYRWVSGPLSMLFRNDQSYTLVAQFHLPINHECGYIEVSPSGLDIMDFIILTFLYVERKRRKESTKGIISAAGRSRNSYPGKGGGGHSAIHQTSRRSGDVISGTHKRRSRAFWGGGDAYAGGGINDYDPYDYGQQHDWSHGHGHGGSGHNDHGGFNWGGGGDFGGNGGGFDSGGGGGFDGGGGGGDSGGGGGGGGD